MTDRVGVELQKQVADLERGMAGIQSVHDGIIADLVARGIVVDCSRKCGGEKKP